MWAPEGARRAIFISTDVFLGLMTTGALEVGSDTQKLFLGESGRPECATDCCSSTGTKAKGYGIPVQGTVWDHQMMLVPQCNDQQYFLAINLPEWCKLHDTFACTI